MYNPKKSIYLSLAVCTLTSVILLIFTFFGPQIMSHYLVSYRGLTQSGEVVRRLISIFCWCFYPSLMFAIIALYQLFTLLLDIKNKIIFTAKNVKRLRVLSWCCFAVTAITFAGGFFYLPFFFCTAAAGFVGVLLRVLKNVMQSAVHIKTENELTV